MIKKIACALMIFIILNAINMMFTTNLLYAKNSENEIFNYAITQGNGNKTLSNNAVPSQKSNELSADWHRIFNRKTDFPQENSEDHSQSFEDGLYGRNFNESREWAKFAHVEGDITRLVVGVNGQRSVSLLALEEITSRYQAKIVNKIWIKGEVKAVVVEVPVVYVTEFVKETRTKELASYIEPNMRFQAMLVPNDAYWNLQWGPKKIGADWAWNTTIGSSDILVAVVDTGIYYYHEDLASNYVGLGYDWVNMDTDPIDDNGHGTHCAGIIAAVLNNGIGIAGIAQVRIMAEKVLTSGGWGYADWIANGIIHAADCGAKIISLSLGGYGYSELLHEAVKYAYDKGALIIAAAGNDDTNMKVYPAGYEEVIAVAATDQYDNKAWFSNWGDWIELAAPGVDIYSTVLSGYAYLSGTSMACPHVSGVSALVWSLYPNRTRDWVRLWLRYTADDLGDYGYDVYYGYGRVNARKAVETSPPLHELIAYELTTSPYVEPGSIGIINGTVMNFGENIETSINVQLIANGSVVDSKVIDSLAVGNSAAISLFWNPTVEGLYNITFYVVPVPGETNVENNVLWKYIYVGFPIKAVVLHSAGNVYSDIITNWQVLNSEWHLFGDAMIYIDYATLNKEDVTYEDIASTKADVLIISCAYDPYAGWEFKDPEIEAITRYVYEGHGLIATAGTFYYYVPNNNKLAQLFGLKQDITWHVAGTDLLHLINASHPLFMKVPNPLVFPEVGTAIPSDGAWDSNELVDGVYLALGHFRESAVVTRRGLVYISPWLEIIPPYYHHHLQLLYNAIVWSRYQRPEHELDVSLEAPKYLKPGDSAVLKATVRNVGLNNETNVELNLLIDGYVVCNATIPMLRVDETYTINYLWTPIAEKTYNITAYAPPLPNEEIVLNNVATKKVRVTAPIKVAVLGDYNSQLADLLRQNGIIVHAREWDIIADIYEYDAVVVNRPSDPGKETFLTFIQAADQHNVGLVFTSSWPVYEPYGISLLQWYLGDPQSQSHDYGRGSVYYKVTHEHPIFEGWSIGDTIYIITSGDRDHAWFWGYTGITIADLGADYAGVRGGGVAYKIRESGNKHLLLAGLAPQWYANVMHWTEEAKNIFVNGVFWAVTRPEHDLAASLEAPDFLMPGDSVLLNAAVLNRGLKNETNVEFQLLINGQLMLSQTITELFVGAIHKITYLWTPTVAGTYNITVYVSPVEGETLIVNNVATKLVKVTYPLIHPIEGQYANYTLYYVDPSTGQEIVRGIWNFSYSRYISPFKINVTMHIQDPFGYVQTGWLIVNIFTRLVEADSGIGWAGMWYPGWIETDVAKGSMINLLWGNATIIDSEVILISGVPIDCWEIRMEEYGYVYRFFYDKKSGLWTCMEATVPSYINIYLVLTSTNVPIGFKYEHDLAVGLAAPLRLPPGTTTIINATIYNTGLRDETNVTLQLFINGEAVDSCIIPELKSGSFYTFSHLWASPLEGVYNITVHAPPLEDEEYLENNVKTKIVHVGLVDAALISDHSELAAIAYILDSMGLSYDVYNDNSVHLYTSNLSLLLNYRVVIFYTDYRWITPGEQSALNSYLALGGNLVVTGFDCLLSDARLADVVRSTTIGDNVGKPDLYVVDAAHPIMNGPYGSFPAGYHVKYLFSDCDMAEADTARGAVTVAELGDGYDKIIATENLPGKVVFWNGRGDYDWASSVDCQVMFKNMIFWMTIKPEHDLIVTLEAPTSLETGETAILKAAVKNCGLSNETYVQLQLLINNVVVLSEVFPELPVGESHTIEYLWTPTVKGIYNITAYAPPTGGEELTGNNKITKIVFVGLPPPGASVVYVSPPLKNVAVGETFTVNVDAANISDVFAYEFKLYYKRSILNCVNISLPRGHFLEPQDPNNLFVLKLEFNNEYNATHGRIWVAMTLLAPEQPKSGSGVLVAVSFYAVDIGETLLDLSSTKFANDKAEPIPHIALDGYVTVGEAGAVRDVAITSVLASVEEAYVGWNIQVFVTAANMGNVPETFNVTVYYGNNIGGTQTVSLSPNEETLLTFNLSTSKMELYVNYTIWAEAHAVPGETNLDNNVYINGSIKIKIIGDINGDKAIDIFDLVSIGQAFSTQPSDPGWNPSADINQDYMVDVFDLVIVAIHFGETYVQVP